MSCRNPKCLKGSPKGQKEARRGQRRPEGPHSWSVAEMPSWRSEDQGHLSPSQTHQVHHMAFWVSHSLCLVWFKCLNCVIPSDVLFTNQQLLTTIIEQGQQINRNKYTNYKTNWMQWTTTDMQWEKKLWWDIFCEAKKVFERPWCWNFFYDNDAFKLVKVCKRQDSITFSDWILNFGYHGYHGYIDYPDYLEKIKISKAQARKFSLLLYHNEKLSIILLISF